MYTVKDYYPSKPFFTMSIKELVKHNIKCKKLDKYFKKKRKNKFKKQTKNRKNRKTRKRGKTRKLSLQKKFLKIIN